MEKADSMFKAIEAADLGRYQMRQCEIQAIYERYKHDRARMIMEAFTYGFVKGQRASKRNATRAILCGAQDKA